VAGGVHTCPNPARRLRLRPHTLAKSCNGGVTPDLFAISLNIDSFEVKHTVYVGNDNDFLATFNGQDNPNQFFAFAFDDVDLPFYEPQRFHDDHERDN